MAELGYRARLPGSVVARIARTEPGAGAAVAAGLEGLGKVALRVSYQQDEVRQARDESEFRIAQVEQQRSRATAVADGMGRLAQLQLDTEAELQALRDRTEAGAGGYEETAEEVYRRRWREFEGTLPKDPEVREHFAPMGARWLGSGISQERGWAREKRVTHLGKQFESSLDTYAAALFSSPSADTFQSLLTDFDSAIALQDIDGTAKAALQQQVRQKLTGAMFDGMLQQGGYEAVEAAVGSGRFDEWIGGAEGKGRWLDRAGAGREAAARMAEAEQSAARRAAREAIEAIDARIDIGEPVPQSEINAAIAAGQEAGVDADVLIRASGAGARASARDAARAMDTPELEAQFEALQQRRRGGGASAAEVRQVEALEAELKARDIDAGNRIRELAKQGPDGQVLAATQLAGMNVERRWAAAREAGDERLAVYTNLTPRGRSFAAEGRALREARADDFLPPKDSRGRNGGRDAAAEAFRSLIGQDLTDQLGGAYDEHLEAALDLMAGTARKWDPTLFGRAVQMVFGQTQRADGTSQGGIGTVRGQRVELPPRWSAPEFDNSYSRFDFRGAIYQDGTAAKPADVRNHYRPRYVGDDDRGSLYSLIGPDGLPLLDQKRQPYRLRFPKVPN